MVAYLFWRAEFIPSSLASSKRTGLSASCFFYASEDKIPRHPEPKECFLRLEPKDVLSQPRPTVVGTAEIGSSRAPFDFTRG